MIGPPVNKNFYWDQVQVGQYDDNGNISFNNMSSLSAGQLIYTNYWRWDNGQYYAESSRLMAGEGYWVRAKGPNVVLRFPGAQIAQLSTPRIMLARAVEKIKQFSGKIFAQREAIADDNSTPPMPMDSLGIKKEEDESSFVFGCFISSAMETFSP